MTMRSQNNEMASAPPLLFQLMARRPCPFMIAVPLLLVILLVAGWTRENVIDEDIARLWIPSDGSYAKDTAYARQVQQQAPQKTGGSVRRILVQGGAANIGASPNMEGVSAFLAMAIGRHGDNLLTEENLETIRQRMQLVESIHISHQGNNYTWDDVCSVNGLDDETTYKFPCLRLSPMDLFQEAGWYFKEEHKVTWYQEGRQAMKPIVNRFGVMLEMCTTPSGTDSSCDHLVKLRTDPEYAAQNGYPPEYAQEKTKLIHDMYTLPGGDTCNVCIENNLPVRMNQLYSEQLIPSFTILTQELRRLLFAMQDQGDAQDWALQEIRRLIKKTASVAIKATLADVEEFYMYYTIRRLYATWGAEDYQLVYREINGPKYRGMFCGVEGIVCPPEDVTVEESAEHLYRHADSTFSSISTAGAPFPFWGATDGTGALFAGSLPVSGSGVNMSAPMESMATYLDLENHNAKGSWRPYFYKRNNAGYLDPLGDNYLWKSMVQSNPLYAWFMAGETEMTAHCGNEDLKGTNVSDITVNAVTSGVLKRYTQRWCTNYSTPFEQDGTGTQQHFARMWFELLIDSKHALNITQGISDPYTWTIGAGCGYSLGGSRFSYRGQTEQAILERASTALYNVDEGIKIGEVDRTMFIGDAYPPVGEYTEFNPLQHVGLLQNLYPAMIPSGIVERVKHKNRPNGPVRITTEDAAQILAKFKEAFQGLWSTGWDDDENGGDVQFVGFFDDAGVPGTIGGFLRSTTVSSGLLEAVSFLVIGAFSVIFLTNCNPIESRAGITVVGVLLVMLSFFSAVGFGILIGIKVNLTTAWTLPFVVVGIGIDNMYIVLLSLRQQHDYSEKSFLKGMQEVLAPISMSSIVNASIFLILNSNSMPAVYLTAQVGLFSIIFLYLSIIFCFPAYCYLDMRRQKASRRDVLVWIKCSEETKENTDQCDRGHWLENIMFGRFYQPLLLGSLKVRRVVHAMVFAVALGLLGLGCLGISNMPYGLGLEDVLPSSNQAQVWAKAHSEALGTWIVGMNWGALDYGDSDVQMQMMKQFEDVVSSQYITDMDTQDLWIASFNIWTTRQCEDNGNDNDISAQLCGMDLVYRDNSTCSGTWKPNKFGLRLPQTPSNDEIGTGLDSCAIPKPKSGVCRPTSELHPDDLMDLGVESLDNRTWCPVFEGWPDDKISFCLERWGGGGGLIRENGQVKVPMPLSSGPTITGFGMTSNEKTMAMMSQTRSVCDDNPSLHCWMTGPPFDFWTQYEGIYMNLLEVGGTCVIASLVVSFLFLACRLFYEGIHGPCKVLFGSAMGALLVALTCLCSLVAVIGLSSLVGVSLTAFSTMSFILSVGFAVEYTVHIVSRWLRADNSKQQTSLDRVDYTMSCLMLPTWMSFVSSVLGVACLAFSSFEFNFRFFFKPLIIAMFVAYFYGCYFLPVALTWLDFDAMKLGPKYRLEDDVFLSPLAKQISEPSEEVEECSIENLDVREIPTDDDEAVGRSTESALRISEVDSRLSHDGHIFECPSSSDVMSGLSSLESLQPGTTNSIDETVQIRNVQLLPDQTNSLDDTIPIRNNWSRMASPSSLLGSLKKILSSSSSQDTFDGDSEFQEGALKGPSGEDDRRTLRRSTSPETYNTSSSSQETESSIAQQEQQNAETPPVDRAVDRTAHADVATTHAQQLILDPDVRTPQCSPSRIAPGVSSPRHCRPGHYHAQINEDDAPGRRPSPVKVLQTIASGMFTRCLVPQPDGQSTGRLPRTSFSLSPRKRTEQGTALDPDAVPSSLSMSAMEEGAYDFSSVIEAPPMPSADAASPQVRVTLDDRVATRPQHVAAEQDKDTIIM